MPKVYHIKSRKDYPQFGIAKGVLHYYWVLKTGPRSSREFRQMTPPKRSQLTTSEFLSSVYDIEDRISALDDLNDLTDIIQELRDLGDAQQGKYDNMPDGLQQGTTGQMIESRATGCSNAADELEGIEQEFQNLGFDRNADGEFVSEDGDVPDDAQEQYDALLEQVHCVSINYE